MSVKLRRNKDLTKEFRKISSDILDKSLQALSKRSPSHQGKGVHEARKGFKQVRGVIRLIRYQLGDKLYRDENQVFRDAGRPLSAVRDADVLIETLDGLIRHFEDQVNEESFQKLRRELVSRRKKIRKQILVRDGVMPKVARSAREAKKRIKQWSNFDENWKFLGKGIRQVYDRGKQEMQRSLSNGSDENLHEWRKSVKYLRYQLEILEGIWPPVIGNTATELHKLADALGTDHDLAVLRNLVHEECADFCEGTEKELLLGLIHQRRMELQDEAKFIGQRVYAETGKEFRRRLKDYWNAWQQET